MDLKTLKLELLERIALLEDEPRLLALKRLLDGPPTYTLPSDHLSVVREGAAPYLKLEDRLYTAEEVRKRDLMGRIVGRMRQRSLSFAMDLLQQNVSAARQERAGEERRQKIVSRVVRRMLNQAQAGAFERWSTNVSELARQRDIMDRILRRMLNANMSAGQSKPMCA